MIILPAIDIIEQKPVRLYQGDYNRQEQVGNNILDLAKIFEKEDFPSSMLIIIIINEMTRPEIYSILP